MAEMTIRLLSLLAIFSVISTDDISPPQTVSVSPNFGSVSGGIVVTVRGTNLNQSSSVMHVAFNDSNHIYICQILTIISSTQIQILIPKYDGGGSMVGNKTFTFHLILNGTWSSNETAKFTYKPDPVIFDVTPKTSILAGGTTLTVMGVNFDSVSKIVMNEMITSDGFRPNDLFTDSYFHNSTCAKFYTPPVSYTGNTTTSSSSNNGAIKTIQMLIGISFDDIAYNFSASVSVFPNPGVLPWNPNQETFVANQNNEISIDVSWPAMNFSTDDIAVSIGSKSCSDLRQINGTLFCRPPPLSPNAIRFGSVELVTPSVVVSIGNVKYTVGSLLYTSEEPFHVIMIVTLAVLAFIFLLAFLFGCIALCCPRGPAVGRKNKTNGVDGQASTLAYHEVGDNFGRGIGSKGRHESFDIIALEYRQRGEDANANEEEEEEEEEIEVEKAKFRKLDEDSGPSKIV